MVEPLKDIIFIRYLDHVLFNRTLALAMKPQTRETIGWLVYEGEQYVTVNWDRDAEPPKLKGGDPKASGLVVLKSDIIEWKKLETRALPLQENSGCHLNSHSTTGTREYAFRPTERKTHGAKDSRRNQKL